jgi:metal-responsive CopG/Arc/MetJ family transcriptional regulator
MQQSAKRLTILVNNDELAAIDDFRFENRLRNRSDAVRALLKLALVRSRKIKKNPPK